ncbi:MAG TPA: hypothetical protein VG474_13875 [Solirubrobacteraceae bacterium]|nr:hypothetical protein [Solirubrobacteraceae bacterium]
MEGSERVVDPIEAVAARMEASAAPLAEDDGVRRFNELYLAVTQTPGGRLSCSPRSATAASCAISSCSRSGATSASPVARCCSARCSRGRRGARFVPASSGAGSCSGQDKHRL